MRNRSILSWSAVLALGCLIAGPARAESGTQFGVGAGVAIPGAENHLKDTAKDGFDIDLHVLHFVSPRVALGGQADYIKFGAKTTSDSDGTNSGSADTKADALSLLGIARLNLVPEGRWLPYVFAGAGVAKFSEDITVNAKLFGTSFSVDTSADSTDFTYALGAGLDLMVSDKSKAGLVARWQVFRLDNSFAVNQVHEVSVLAQWSWMAR